MEHQNRLGRWLQIRKIKSRLQFPSLFSRLVSIYISILIIMLVILFVTFTNSFQSYFVKYTQEIMVNQAKSIASEYQEEGRDTTSSEAAVEKILSKIQLMNSTLNATIWLVDHEGEGYEVTEENVTKFVAKADMRKSAEQVFSGHVVDFENGFKESFTTPVLTIGYPVDLDDQIQYALFIHMPMPYILQTIDEVRNLILNAVGFVGSIVFIWIYTISKQMTKPLIQMSQVAKNIASGEFDKRIEVKGNDEIAQLGRSLNHMAEALDKIEEDRRSFIANISHDLRSPLTSIQGFVTAILDGTIDAQHQEKYLNIVLNESKRLIIMTNTILELKQMQEGKKKLEKMPLDIGQLVEEAIVSLENRRQKKSVHILNELGEKPIWVWGEMDGIHRVIQNLLDNAFKFVEAEGHIVIRSKLVKDKVWVSILNDGPIIPKEQQKLIWERFYKGDRSRGQDKKGIGLGLVIVKEILRQHEEVIYVHSEEGKMVEFCFSLTALKQD